MKTVLVVTDPISERASVQFEVLKMFLRGMRTNYNILVATPYIPNKQISELKDSFNVNIHLLSSNKRIYQALLTRFKKNESMLWAISWLFEGLFSSNSIALKERKLNVKDIINTSYTVPALCKIYWNQATPPMITLEQMAKSNLLAKFSLSLFGWIFSLLDRKVLKKHLESSKKIAHNSEYLMDLYAEYGVNSKVVIHSPKEFHDFIPSDISPSKDYVLAYIGKEVMVSTILKIADFNLGMAYLNIAQEVHFSLYFVKGFTSWTLTMKFLPMAVRIRVGSDRNTFFSVMKLRLTGKKTNLSQPGLTELSGNLEPRIILGNCI